METETRKPSALDIGEALKRTAILLDVIEQSGKDLDALTEPELDEEEWERLHVRAAERESWNPHFFGGETEAFITLRNVENAEIRAEAHKQVKFYWRRAKTSGKIAHGLWASYRRDKQQAELSGQSASDIDCQDYRKKLNELLSVMGALAEEHAQIVTLAQDAQLGDRECVTRRYEEQIAPLLEQFDELHGQYEQLGKVHFKRRKALHTEMQRCLSRIDETNKVFEHYTFMDFHTRDIPQS